MITRNFIMILSEDCIRSEEHTSELQSHSEISYAVFCLKKKKKKKKKKINDNTKKKITIKKIIQVIFFFFLFFFLFFYFFRFFFFFFFFFNDTATTEIYTLSYTLSLHDALPIYSSHIQKSRMPSSACDWS